MAIPVIYQLLTMVLLMVVGVILNKKKFLTEHNAKGLSIVLTRVAVPANMIVLMQRPFSHEILIGFLKTCGGMFLMCALGAVLFFIIGKAMKMQFPELGLVLWRRCLQQCYLHGAAFDYGHVRRGRADFLRGSYVHLQCVPVYCLLCALCHWQCQA